MPPLVGVAVNVTELPLQVGLAPVVMAMATAGVTEPITVPVKATFCVVAPVLVCEISPLDEPAEAVEANLT